MKKEIGLALLGISLALGTTSVSFSAVFPEYAGRTEGQSLRLAAVTREEIREIRECVLRRDILCLRSILVGNPDLLQDNTELSRALLNFANLTDAASARDLFSDIEVVVEQAGAIYS